MKLLNDIINRTMEEYELRKRVLEMLEISTLDSKYGIYKALETQAAVFAVYMNMNFDYFIGDTYKEDKKAHRPTMPVNAALFGDYCFDVQDIRTVVENMNYWYERYGSANAVREEVIDWYDHINDPKTKDKVSLFSWLSGCPRPEKGGDDGSD